MRITEVFLENLGDWDLVVWYQETDAAHNVSDLRVVELLIEDSNWAWADLLIDNLLLGSASRKYDEQFQVLVKDGLELLRKQEGK